MPGLRDLATMPFKVGARVLDVATGQSRVNIDSHTTVPGKDPARWADEFIRDPSKISPVASNARVEGERHVGQPFPLGPDIGIAIRSRSDGRTTDGRAQTVLDVQYSGAFEGPGRITITQNRDGTLDVRDQWNDVVNNSFLPTLAAETGHPMVAGLGFKGIGDRATGHHADLISDIGKSVVETSFKVMTAPFRMFFGG
ncbi:MAG: hypothetical protein ABIJ09_14895 [Pseudomonadota bacterium]